MLQITSLLRFFALALVGINPKLTSVLVFGTDRKEVVVKAIKQQFPFAIHLGCFCHMKQDTQRKFSVYMRFPSDTTSTILVHFGQRVAQLSIKGLLIQILIRNMIVSYTP